MFVPMTGEAERARVVLPDGTKPSLLGGSFEHLSADSQAPEGWYYLRYAKVQTDRKAPDGERVITFSNNVPGRNARALQALAVDGRAVSAFDVSFWVRLRRVKAGGSGDQTPRLAIVFFGEDRTPLGEPAAVGGWTGTFDWRKATGTVNVPRDARMAIIWIGLLGATGEASFDGVSLIPSLANATAPVGPTTGTPK